MFVKAKAKWQSRSKCQDPLRKRGLQAVLVQHLHALTSTLGLRHVIVPFHWELSLKKNNERAKIGAPHSPFPSSRSLVYKAALWKLTQITLPTPAGMKTKVGEAMVAPRWPLCLSLPSGSGRHFPCVGGRFLHCVGGKLHWRMGGGGPYQQATARLTFSGNVCQWPEVRPGFSSLLDPWELQWRESRRCRSFSLLSRFFFFLFLANAEICLNLTISTLFLFVPVMTSPHLSPLVKFDEWTLVLQGSWSGPGWAMEQRSVPEPDELRR